MINVFFFVLLQEKWCNSKMCTGTESSSSRMIMNVLWRHPNHLLVKHEKGKAGLTPVIKIRVL